MRNFRHAYVAARTLIQLTAIAALSACDNSSSNAVAASPPDRAPVTVTVTTADKAASLGVYDARDSGWNLIEARAVCNGPCAGKEGFAIHQDGHFVAGPDRAGRTIEGQISNDEFAALDHAASLAGEAGRDERQDFCTSTNVYIGTSLGVRMVMSDESSFVVYDQRADGTLCMRGERARVDELESVFSHLMYKYYPETF